LISEWRNFIFWQVVLVLTILDSQLENKKPFWRPNL